MSKIRRFLILPNIQIFNANAFSSPITVGFPAMTAWLGATHALQRHLNQSGFAKLICSSVAVVSHMFQLHANKDKYGDYSLFSMSHPLKKDGGRPSMFPDPKCRLTVSLLIEYEGVSQFEQDAFIETINHLMAAKMKFAGGDVHAFGKPLTIKFDTESDADLRAIRKNLMPGYYLCERRDLMIAAMQSGTDAMDAIIDYLAIHHSSTLNEKNEVSWSATRREPGWIVPIAIGFQGISDVSFAKNQRDPSVLHRFAESIVTLGEFKMPFRAKTIDDMLWSYYYDEPNNLYLCQQNSLALGV